MPDWLISLGVAARRWPLYVGLVLLALAGLAGAGLRGYRLLGDDNHRTGPRRHGPPPASQRQYVYP